MTLDRWHRVHRGGAGTLPTQVDTNTAPCRLMPEYWDAPTSDAGWARDRDRVKFAVEKCRTCPALAACLRFVASWDHPDGVVAGQVWRNGVRLS